MNKLDKQQHQEYAQWLQGFEWTYFATFTTGYTLSLKAARRAIERLYMRMEGIDEVFWVAEPFKVKGGCHIHCLIKTKFYTSSNIRQGWEITAGSLSIIEKKKLRHRSQIIPYNKNLGASWYVLKYLNHPHADYSILTKSDRV